MDARMLLRQNLHSPKYSQRRRNCARDSAARPIPIQERWRPSRCIPSLWSRASQRSLCTMFLKTQCRALYTAIYIWSTEESFNQCTSVGCHLDPLSSGRRLPRGFHCAVAASRLSKRNTSATELKRQKQKSRKLWRRWLPSIHWLHAKGLYTKLYTSLSPPKKLSTYSSTEPKTSFPHSFS